MSSAPAPSATTTTATAATATPAAARKITARQRLVLGLTGALPFSPFLVALLIHAPLAGPDIKPLTGTWQVREEAGPADAPRVDAQFPGRMPSQFEQPLLERTITLPAAPDGPSLLVLGGFSNIVGEVSLNGRWLGSEGVIDRGYKLEHVTLAAYPVAPGLLVAGDNLLSVRLRREGHDDSGPQGASLVEHRILIGPWEHVRPWFDRITVMERTLDLGGVVLLVFLAALVLVLARAESDPTARRVQMFVALMCLAIAVYLSGKSGLAVALGLDRGVVPKAITIIALSIVEVMERALLGRVTRVQKLNRVVCLGHFTLQFLAKSPLIYALFIPYLFVMIIYGAFLCVRAAHRTPTQENMLLAGALLAIGVAGVNDLLTDMSVVIAPRLFTLAAVDTGVIAAVFVVSRFVRAMLDNTELLARVEEKNRELGAALDRAEESTRLKSAFLANTSHELRTPLNSIINVPEGLLEEFVQKPFISCSGCSSLFEAPANYKVKPGEKCPECGATGTLSTELRAVFSGDPDAAMRYLKAIQQSGRHLLAVVNDILDFSKLEAGKMQLHLEDARLGELLERLELAVLPLAESRSITLKVDRPLEDDALRTDVTKMTQVLMNLLSNAIKFSPEGSTVEVRYRLEPERVTLEVADHGIGIAPDDQARIFESFLQLDNSHTRKVGGTGLGLAISKRICELSGGSLTVQSTMGEGSTFTISVPRDPPPSVD